MKNEPDSVNGAFDRPDFPKILALNAVMQKLAPGRPGLLASRVFQIFFSPSLSACLVWEKNMTLGDRAEGGWFQVDC
jgi:hypothetical protein